MSLPVLRPLSAADLEHVLERARPIWQELRGQRLFITGGTGLFGIWLLESIKAANARLDTRISATVLSRDPKRFLVRAPHLADLASIGWHPGDARSFTFPAGRYDHVIHAAAPTTADMNAERPDEAFDTIGSGTRRALELAAAAGAANVLFVSSGAVYGRQPPTLENVPETYLGAPECTDRHAAYAEGKRAAELLCAFATRPGGPQAKIARCFAFVGPHLPLDAHFAVGNFLRDALRGGDIAIAGDGTPCRSYMHMADLVVWLLTIMMSGAPMRAYNVGSDEAVSIAELAQRVARVVGKGSKVRISGQASGAPPERYVPSIDRARQELGLEVCIGLDAALERTVRWLMQ